MISCRANEFRIIKNYGLDAPTIEVKEKKAFVNGTLGRVFYNLLLETINKNAQIETIVLLEVPGSVNDEWNLKACLLLNKKGLNTELLSNSMVESGGTDLFVSGKKNSHCRRSKNRSACLGRRKKYRIGFC